MPRPPDNTHSPAMKTLAGASVGLSASSTDPVRLALPGVGESCALWAVGQLRYPFAKLVLSVPEVLAMFRILGRRGYREYVLLTVRLVVPRRTGKDTD